MGAGQVIGGASQSSSPEFRRFESNTALLERIAGTTGGALLDVASRRIAWDAKMLARLAQRASIRVRRDRRGREAAATLAALRGAAEPRAERERPERATETTSSLLAAKRRARRRLDRSE